MNWYLEALKKYAVFDGRSRRSEFWYFALFNILANIVLSIVDATAGLRTENGFGVLSGLYGLGVLIPGLEVSVRRLHDIGKSGWWLLIAFIPLIGAIMLIVYYARDSERGANAYGSNPKQLAV